MIANSASRRDGDMASLRSMSLAIATRVTEGVVLCEDTRITLHSAGANYVQDGNSKLRFFGEGTAVAITGDVPTVLDFLERAEREDKAFRRERMPSQTIRDLQILFRKFYRELVGSEPDPNASTATTLLFAGRGLFAGKKETFIYRMELNHNFDCFFEPRFGIAGQHRHGGLYYHTRFLRQDMNPKEAAFLSYWCIGEVSALDGSVGEDVEIVLCTDNGPKHAPDEWLQGFQDRRENARQKMKEWFFFDER